MKKRIFIAATAALAAAAVLLSVRYYQRQILPHKQLEQAYARQMELFSSIRPIAALSPEISAETENAAEKTDSTAAASESNALAKTDAADPLLSAQTITVTEETLTTEGNYLEAAAAVNGQVVGWLHIPGTQIDYPITQAQDNDFYLHNGFDGTYNNELGSPFLDYRCASDFSGFNSILYAHNMEGQQMFADVLRYQDKRFLETHDRGTLVLPDKVLTVRFFAYLSVSQADQVYEVVHITDRDKQDYLDHITDTAYTQTEIQPDVSSRLILLSTCTLAYEGARGVLVGLIES